MLMRDGEIQAKVSALMPEILADLERLVSIPSVAFPGYPPGPVHEMASETLGLFLSVASPTPPCWRCRVGSRRFTGRSAVRRERRL
jgi:hypothetical protein